MTSEYTVGNLIADLAELTERLSDDDGRFTTRLRDFPLVVAFRHNGETVVSNITGVCLNGQNLQLNEEIFNDFDTMLGNYLEAKKIGEVRINRSEKNDE